MPIFHNNIPALQSTLREKYGEIASKSASSYIITSRKLEKCELAIDFIKVCLNHEKNPNFSIINLGNSDLNNDKAFIRRIQNEITERELLNKSRTRRKLKTHLQNLQNQLFDLTPEHWQQLQTATEILVERDRELVSKTHSKKLLTLGINKRIVIDESHITRRGNNRDTSIADVTFADAIFNLSSRILLF